MERDSSGYTDLLGSVVGNRSIEGSFKSAFNFGRNKQHLVLKYEPDAVRYL
jgi:hypothetical protein